MRRFKRPHRRRRWTSERIKKVDEIPYDFVRKRLSVVAADAKGERTLITKGALDNILSICKDLKSGDETHPIDAPTRSKIDQRYSEWSEKGFRVLGLAIKTVDKKSESYSRTDENALTFAGFLLFFDPPKTDVQQVIVDLAKRGVQIKIITGDNQKVARHVAESVHLTLQGVLTGSQLNDMRDEALWHLAERTTLSRKWIPIRKSASSSRCKRPSMWSAIWAMVSTMRRLCTLRT